MADVVDTKTGRIYKYNEVPDDLYQDYQKCNPHKEVTVTDVENGKQKTLPLIQLMLHAIWRNTIGLFRG